MQKGDCNLQSYLLELMKNPALNYQIYPTFISFIEFVSYLMGIFNFSFGRDGQSKLHAFANTKTLFGGLKREDTTAIQYLHSKISNSVFGIGKSYKLADEDVEELICDCITLFILKVRDGLYVYQGFDPATYVIEIAKNKVKNYGRFRKKYQFVEMDLNFDIMDESDPTDLAATEILEKLISQLSENCKKLIQLKYLDEIRDKEVVEKNLTQYKSVDSLKNHRALCMKKLSEIAASTFK